VSKKQPCGLRESRSQEPEFRHPGRKKAATKEDENANALFPVFPILTPDFWLLTPDRIRSSV